MVSSRRDGPRAKRQGNGRLRNATADSLIATDLAARGLDIEQPTRVINYNVPSAPEAYIHRIGRIGHAGRAGMAIILAEPGSTGCSRRSSG
jgi:ATP-dependent RNA helicase DeaD